MTNSELARVDPLVQNLLVARELPTLAHIDIGGYLDQADSWAGRIADRVCGNEPEFYKTPQDWQNCIHLFRLGVMCAFLDRTAGVAYRESHIDLAKVRYTDPNDIFLTGIFDERRGTCGTMAATHLALGWRLRWPVSLTMIWWHTMLRFDDGDVVWNVETTNTGKGGFSCKTDEFVIRKFDIQPEHVRCGSDLVTLTPRQVLGVFFGFRARHHYGTGKIEEARVDFRRTLDLYPESRVFRKMVRQCDELVGDGKRFYMGVVYKELDGPPPVQPPIGTGAVLCGAGLDTQGMGDDWFMKVAAILNRPTEESQGFQGGDPDLYRYVGNDPTNATDPTGLWKWKINPEGNLLAVAEAGDSLSTLTKLGYDAQSIIKIAKLAGYTEYAQLKAGESLDLSALLPDNAQRAMRIQQTLSYEEIRSAVLFSDNPNLDKKIPKGKTVGNCGLDLAIPKVYDEKSGAKISSPISDNAFGVGQCHGFTALMLGAQMPPKYDPREFSLGVLKGKDDAYYEKDDFAQARSPGLEIFVTVHRIEQ